LRNFKGLSIGGTSYLEFLVEQLTKAAKQRHSEVLVVCSNDRSGLPYWILGSFSETATLTASYPLLVIKPTSAKGLFSKEVRFVLSIDVAEIPSSNYLRWIAMTAKISNALLYLVYVRPRRRKIVGSLQSPKDSVDAENILSKIQSFFETAGIRTQSNILKESKSIAHSLAQFSDSRKAWLTISTHVKRSRVRKLILGSTARRFLKLTKRPFLHLRLNS